MAERTLFRLREVTSYRTLMSMLVPPPRLLGRQERMAFVRKELAEVDIAKPCMYRLSAQCQAASLKGNVTYLIRIRAMLEPGSYHHPEKK